MTKRLSKRERLARTIAGRAVDRLPVSLWRHFYSEETSREGLVGAMRRWQETFDWDFLKINPRFGYHCQDWGNQYSQSTSDTIPPVLVRSAVHRADDFRHLDRLDAAGKSGRRAPVLEEHLGAVGDLRRALGPDVPMLMTVFTPMSIAAELAGGPQDLAALIAEDATMVHVGLRTITDTFRDFAAACIAAGADGIFLATTHVATLTNFTADEYQEFGRPYDLEVLEAVRDAPLNLLHVCKSRCMVRELADYPVQMLNWDMADPSNPPLAAMRPAARDKALVGGVDRAAFSLPDSPEAVAAQVRAARQAMGRRPFVLGSTCTVDPTASPDAIRALCDAAGRI